LDEDEKGIKVGDGFITEDGRVAHVVYIDRQDDMCEVEFQVRNTQKQLVIYEQMRVSDVQRIIYKWRFGRDLNDTDW